MTLPPDFLASHEAGHAVAMHLHGRAIVELSLARNESSLARVQSVDNVAAMARAETNIDRKRELAIEVAATALAGMVVHHDRFPAIDGSDHILNDDQLSNEMQRLCEGIEEEAYRRANLVAGSPFVDQLARAVLASPDLTLRGAEIVALLGSAPRSWAAWEGAERSDDARLVEVVHLDVPRLRDGP